MGLWLKNVLYSRNVSRSRVAPRRATGGPAHCKGGSETNKAQRRSEALELHRPSALVAVE